MDRRHLTVVRGAGASGVSTAGDSDPPDTVFDELLTLMTGDDAEQDEPLATPITVPRAAQPLHPQQGGEPIASSSNPDPAGRHV